MSKLTLAHREEFSDKDEFVHYIERLDNYFVANGVGSDKQVEVFLSLIGAKTYKVLCQLVQPLLPEERTYGDLVKVLREHLMPAPVNIIAERFRFYRREQEEYESVFSYLVELRQLAVTCNFNSFLNEALRDRFICGIRSETIQNRLLATSDLTLSSAVEIATAMELEEKHIQVFHGASSRAEPSTVKIRKNSKRNHNHCDSSALVPLTSPTPMSSEPAFKRTRTKSWKKRRKAEKAALKRLKSRCHCCGGKHSTSTCKHRDAACYTYEVDGQISQVCRRVEGTR